ncbi:protein translocase subunit secE/sec61 gamma [Fructobacillus pseudoficulneus]|uniref:Protein translocase subunit secE/sec61 gamma n=1 Tax=Fructobacillus pseudoficulneus TaxID=220714 RepID=A0A3F3GVL9_9LACO|nr:preprotein translocase subunit SecE [Fructobacillus pseudoficulneus]GAP03345.1 protein translocase subunit secE/sec61 gamma [Fructobacillus pseudoficulneus]SEH43892.1 preprotein translocase subunit SecE [Fructobacillus pseudoficulneus]
MITYFKNVAAEMRKVSWLSMEQTTRETIAVISISIIFAAIIGASDWLLQQGVNLFLSK